MTRIRCMYSERYCTKVIRLHLRSKNKLLKYLHLMLKTSSGTWPSVKQYTNNSCMCTPKKFQNNQINYITLQIEKMYIAINCVICCTKSDILAEKTAINYKVKYCFTISYFWLNNSCTRKRTDIQTNTWKAIIIPYKDFKIALFHIFVKNFRHIKSFCNLSSFFSISCYSFIEFDCKNADKKFDPRITNLRPVC